MTKASGGRPTPPRTAGPDRRASRAWRRQTRPPLRRWVANSSSDGRAWATTVCGMLPIQRHAEVATARSTRVNSGVKTLTVQVALILLGIWRYGFDSTFVYITLSAAFSLWALISLWQRRPGIGRGIFWFSVTIVLPFLGALFYLAFFRPPPPLEASFHHQLAR